MAHTSRVGEGGSAVTLFGCQPYATGVNRAGVPALGATRADLGLESGDVIGMGKAGAG